MLVLLGLRRNFFKLLHSLNKRKRKQQYDCQLFQMILSTPACMKTAQNCPREMKDGDMDNKLRVSRKKGKLLLNVSLKGSGQLLRDQNQCKLESFPSIF